MERIASLFARALRAGVALAWCSSALLAADLDTLFARMDEASREFRSLAADLVKVTHTAVINDNSEEAGRILVLRSQPKNFRMLVEINRPEARAIAFQGRRLQVYYPKLQTVQIYDLGKHSQLVDQFLLLGFGTSGAELRRNYKIAYGGTERVQGVACTRLDLTPVSGEVRQHFEKLHLWISDEGGYPVRQKLVQPSQDYVLVTYSNIRVNPPLTPSQVDLRLPPGVKRQEMR